MKHLLDNDHSKMSEVKEIDELSRGRTFHLNKDLPLFAEKLMELKLRNKKDQLGTIEKENNAHDLNKINQNKQRINLTGNYARNTYYTSPDETQTDNHKIKDLEAKVKQLESFVTALNNQLNKIATQLHENPNSQIVAKELSKAVRTKDIEDLVNFNKAGDHSSVIHKMVEYVQKHKVANDELESNVLKTFANSVAYDDVIFRFE